MYALISSSCGGVRVRSISVSTEVGSGVPMDSSIFRDGSVKSDEGRRIVSMRKEDRR